MLQILFCIEGNPSDEWVSPAEVEVGSDECIVVGAVFCKRRNQGRREAQNGDKRDDYGPSYATDQQHGHCRAEGRMERTGEAHELGATCKITKSASSTVTAIATYRHMRENDDVMYSSRHTE